MEGIINLISRKKDCTILPTCVLNNAEDCFKLDETILRSLYPDGKKNYLLKCL